jgi:N-acetylmuramoyl-L-alanine amidase
VTLPPAAQAPQQTVAPDLGPSAGVRTVILDPGHGGDDAGVHGPKGTLEKDVTLQLAKKLKAAIESRVGIRALLTRDADESASVDKRTAFANNARGDLLISLHVNASLRTGAHGASVWTLGADQYKSRANDIGAGDRIPVVGGGTRLIQTVPWELAQLPFVDKSANFAATTIRHLSAQNVPLFSRSSQAAPLVGLAGINMPAILLEAGFLSNPDDERGLTGDAATAIVEALVDTIVEIRNAGGTAPLPSPHHP